MMILVTVDGFRDSIPIEFIQSDALPASDSEIAVDLACDADPALLKERFNSIYNIRIRFPTSADGRGFSIAHKLRQLGYEGCLRAHGHLISDQFRHALDCGFNEVEIDQELANRQPEAHWKDFGQSGYRQKLGSPPGQRQGRY